MAKLEYAQVNPRAWATLCKLRAKIKAMCPYTYVVSDDEHRVMTLINSHIAKPLKKRLVIWSSYRGMLDVSGGVDIAGDEAKTLTKALEWIASDRTPNQYSGSLYILLDAHPHLNVATARQMRDIYVPILTGASDSGTSEASKNIIFLSGRLAYMQGGIADGIEPSLQTEVDVIDFPLPSRKEHALTIDNIISQAVAAATDKRGIKTYTPDEVEEFARALQGLSHLEANRAISECFEENNRSLQVASLLEKKRQVVRRDDVMEIIESPPPMSEVGGLENVKEYIEMYKDQFSSRAEEFGVQPIRGILLVGCPGTGKSLIAKAIASYWQLPCLRLDLGKIFQGLVGASEERIRRAIRVAEAVAPALLFIDEAEKQMSGNKSSNQSDAGTASRVFGTLLTAMEEGLRNVPMLATCNDISALPPELIRRFDEVFFVDLPNRRIRRDILGIHLAKRKQDPSKFDLDELVDITNMFTGSEVEKIVKQGIAIAFNRGEQLSVSHMLEAAKKTRPISTIMSEEIKALRAWAKDRARPAHREEEAVDIKVIDRGVLNSMDSVIARSISGASSGEN